MDRGKQSKDVVSFVRNLVEEHGAVALRGNHDQMFLDFLNKPLNYMAQQNFFRNGGDATIRSYIEGFDSYQWYDDNYIKWTEEIKREHEEDIEFLNNLRYYYETPEYIFVHAGINVNFKDWKNTDHDDFIWIRDQFLKYDHQHEQTVIHGHTPCIYLHESADIYFGNKKIGIDGACAYGHQLNCLEIKDGEYKQFEINLKSNK